MLNLIRYSVVIILILLSPVSIFGQGSNLYFEHLNYDVNYSQSTISSILQGEKGFIWLGTDNGLVRYDGYNYIRYQNNENDRNSLSNNHINVLHEDSQHNLWIGTKNGVNLFNKKTNKFFQIDIPPIKGGRNYISSIIEDDAKNLWIGTFGGVKRLNKQKHLLEDVSKNLNITLFNKSRVLSLFYDKNYGVLVGTSTGLECFDPVTSKLKTLPKAFTENKAFLKSKIWKIIKEKNGDLWFATETMGVFLYSKSKNQLFNYYNDFNRKNTIASNWVNDILSIDNNTVWFGTNDGLSVLKKDKGEFINYKHNPFVNSSLSDNYVKCFLKDRQGSIWLGTIAGGVNFFNQANLNFISVRESFFPNFGLSNALVNSIIEDRTGAFWIGTFGGGLNYLDFATNKSASYLIKTIDRKKTSNMIKVVVDQNNENLLCGTLNGLYQFNKGSKNFKFMPLSKEESEVDGRPISTLLMDNDDIWVGTNGSGLKKIDKSGKIESYLADGGQYSLSDNFIMDIENRKNGLWVATQNGLCYFDKNKKTFLKFLREVEPNSLSSNNLISLFTDSKGGLWIGTDNLGINYFDDKTQKFYAINKSVGFIDGIVNNISEDIDGNLWASSDDQLFKIKIKKFDLPFKASDLEITMYSSKDGLSVKKFSDNCSIKLRNNNLVFGASKGIAIFNPNKIIKTPNKNEIIFTKLKVNNEEVNVYDVNSPLEKPISEISSITLKHYQGYLNLEFSSLNFVNPDKNIYSYKLETLFQNDEWHELGVQNVLNLNALSPGTYNLKIRTSNEEGIWNPKIKNLEIVILSPWWETWWAYFIYLVILGISSWYLLRFIRNKQALKRALFLEQVENERQQELYKMKIDFFTNVSHEIRTPLTLISGPVEELLNKVEPNSYQENKLKIIKNNSDRLLKLVNELMDFRKAEKGSMKIYCEEKDIVSFCFEIYESFRGIAVEKNIDYKFVINSTPILVYFDKNQMEKVVYNLLSNAFKFTGKKGRITLSVELKSDDVETILIKVKDNGIGIPENRKKKIFKNFFQLDDRGRANLGSGIGLALSKSIVELHHGEINVQVENDANFNTIFIISLKKGSSHLKKSQIIENNLVELDFVEQVSIAKPEIIVETVEEDCSDSNIDKPALIVIDDNEELLSFVYDILCDDYRVLKFLSAKLALEHMEKEIPDLIISDVMMPEMDGFELCEIVKTSQNTNHIPIILLTAKSSTQNRIEGLSTGADSYISKPFSIEVLKLNVFNLLKAKEIMRQKYSGRFIVDSDLEKLTTPEEVFLKKLMGIIELNIEKPDFDVNELVGEIGMSRTVLYKKVQTLTNQSVANLIKYVRLRKAADILMNTSYSVSEVTYMVGFNDRKHFSKEFKKMYNLSPTEYKNSKN
jgi:signal transduction histidine kinase/ligand-binding sensor domain-containing protein/DNA-binding response OmpR family regulator